MLKRSAHMTPGRRQRGPRNRFLWLAEDFKLNRGFQRPRKAISTAMCYINVGWLPHALRSRPVRLSATGMSAVGARAIGPCPPLHQRRDVGARSTFRTGSCCRSL